MIEFRVFTNLNDLYDSDVLSKIDHRNFKYWNGDISKNRILFILEFNNSIVAIGEVLKEIDFYKNTLGFCYISVHNNHYGKGYGKIFLQHIFDWITNQNQWNSIKMSDYSVMGFFLLKPFIDSYFKSSKINLIQTYHKPGYPYIDQNGNHHWANTEEEFNQLMDSIKTQIL